MPHHWLLITFSWLGTASLQYINTGGPAADINFDSLDPSVQYPFPYIRPRADSEPAEQQNLDNQENQEVLKVTPTENDTESLEKGSLLTQWGEKSELPMENMWTWKRSIGIREPSMPKRVRFSPWGGKRSGQMVLKPSTKRSKIIFSTSVPELTRIVSNYLPNGESNKITGFQFPYLDKRHPIKILILARLGEKPLIGALPFKSFTDNLPKSFKPGHPYYYADLKGDEKRKVKFSAWGGKRTAPMIGPIWTPALEDIQESNLNKILFHKDDQNKDSV